MTELGYQLSSEEHSAPDLVGYARRAEDTGFAYFRFYGRDVLPQVRKL